MHASTPVPARHKRIFERYTDEQKMSLVSSKHTGLLHMTNVILQVLLPTCAGGTGPMTWFASPSVAVVISPGVTGHLTLVCLKAGK